MNPDAFKRSALNQPFLTIYYSETVVYVYVSGKLVLLDIARNKKYNITHKPDKGDVVFMKPLKKILCGILSAAMLITSAAVPAMADGNINVTLDGKVLSFDVPPQIINERTMVPLRAIFEALGASVDWDQKTQTVTSAKGGTTIKLTIDNNTMFVNGAGVTLDTPACVVEGRTLVPVRAISEAYNTKVDWDDKTRTVIISTGNTASTSHGNTTQSQEKSLLLNHEYGPMTVNCHYSTGDHWSTNNISSLVFTKCETTLIGKYLLHVNMQGVVDYNMADVKVYFYDAHDRAIGEAWFFHDVSPDVPYNFTDSRYIDEDIIDNAARIEFYSYTGEIAVR